MGAFLIDCTHQLLKKTSYLLFLVDKVNLIDPISPLAELIRFRNPDMIVGMKIIQFLVAQHLFMWKISDQMAAMPVAVFPAQLCSQLFCECIEISACKGL